MTVLSPFDEQEASVAEVEQNSSHHRREQDVLVSRTCMIQEQSGQENDKEHCVAPEMLCVCPGEKNLQTGGRAGKTDLVRVSRLLATLLKGLGFTPQERTFFFLNWGPPPFLTIFKSFHMYLLLYAKDITCYILHYMGSHLRL